MVAPVVNEISAEYANVLEVGKVDVDKCPELAKQFRVMSIPTLILFKGGQIVDQKLGFQTKEQLESMIKKAL
jgi:thioredoxin 1